MRFLITLNMPSASGNLVHQINAEYPVDSLEEFVEALSNNEFIIIQEFYRDQTTKEDINRGYVAINYRYVGKIKVINTNPEMRYEISRNIDIVSGRHQ